MKIEVGTIVRWKSLQLSDKDLSILFSKIKAGHQISKIQVTFQTELKEYFGMVTEENEAGEVKVIDFIERRETWFPIKMLEDLHGE